MDPRWSERQRALLQAMGLSWPAGSGVVAEVEAPAAVATAANSVTPVTPGAVRPPLAADAAQALPPPPAAPPASPRPAAVDTSGLADLEAVAEAVRACRACGLCEGRKQAVPGVGHAQAHWMIVGEGPGEQEDLQGEPFVGRSGQLLDEMLAALDLTRAAATPERQVFIANTVKCRPPGNRNPTPDELAACAPYLQRQLALVKPRMVLALGRFAAQSLLGTDAPVGSLRGKLHRLPDGTPLVVSYHPSYLLRQPLEKSRAWDDLCLAAEQLAR